MLEAIHKEDCPEWENFGYGNCECCLDVLECEQATHELKTVKVLEKI